MTQQPAPMPVQAVGADLVPASERWAAAFAGTPLEREDASDLVAGALKTTQAVARAARQLTWETPDAFDAAMRRAEQGDER
jgi:hypothetical protein